MPLTVPMIDQTAMGVQPLAAPSVTPTRNAAPEQLQQSGQAMQQAGALAVKTGQSMTDALNMQVDAAAVRRASILKLMLISKR